MSLVNNIHAQMVTKAANASAGASMNVAGKQTDAGSLEDFIGVILKQVNQADTTKTTASPDKNKTATNAATAADAPADVKEAVEKIAARLNIDPADPQAAEKIAEALLDTAAGANPALTADLSSEFATLIQAVSDNSQIDETLLGQIENALQVVMNDPEVKEKDLIAFSDNLVKELKAKGIPDATIAQYIDMLQLPIGEQAAALVPPASADQLPVTPASLVPAAVTPSSSDASPLASGNADGTDVDSAASLLAAVQAAGTGDLPSLAADDATTSDAAIPVIKTPEDGIAKPVATEHKAAEKPVVAAAKPAIDTSVPADVKTAEAPKPEASAKADARATSTLALVNAMASGDDNFASGLNTTALDNSFTGLQTLVGAKTEGVNNFINYMSADKMPASTMQMIAIQMQQNAASKTSTFTMQLEPADLGRLDIEMSFDKSGSVKAHVSADRPETLSMLQRDSSHLNRILQQAGLDMDDGALTFDLRQDHQAQQDNNAYGQNGRGKSAYHDGFRSQDIMQAQIAVSAMGHISQSGVNIMV